MAKRAQQGLEPLAPEQGQELFQKLLASGREQIAGGFVFWGVTCGLGRVNIRLLVGLFLGGVTCGLGRLNIAAAQRGREQIACGLTRSPGCSRRMLQIAYRGTAASARLCCAWPGN